MLGDSIIGHLNDFMDSVSQYVIYTIIGATRLVKFVKPVMC